MYTPNFQDLQIKKKQYSYNSNMSFFPKKDDTYSLFENHVANRSDKAYLAPGPVQSTPINQNNEEILSIDKSSLENEFKSENGEH